MKMPKLPVHDKRIPWSNLADVPAEMVLFVHAPKPFLSDATHIDRKKKKKKKIEVWIAIWAQLFKANNIVS